MLGHVVHDGLDEFLHASEYAAANTLVGQVAEPSFNQIQPGTAGGNEVHVEAGMTLQPVLGLGVLVRGVKPGRDRLTSITREPSPNSPLSVRHHPNGIPGMDSLPFRLVRASRDQIRLAITGWWTARILANHRIASSNNATREPSSTNRSTSDSSPS